MQFEIENIDQFIFEYNIERIYLDVDGVLWASTKAMAEIMHLLYDTNGSGEDVLSWNFKEIKPDITNAQVEHLFTIDKFFEYVDFIYGAKEFLKKYRNQITIVTKGVPHNYERKRLWFDLNGFSDIPIINIPLEVSKGIIKMGERALFIDDSTNNLLETDAEYKVQFREYNDGLIREWEQGWDGMIMYHW